MVIELVGRDGCHLCEEAQEVLARVCSDAGQSFMVHSIDNDPELADRYWEKIPVLLIDGEVFDFWRINEPRLRDKLQAL